MQKYYSLELYKVFLVKNILIKEGKLIINSTNWIKWSTTPEKIRTFFISLFWFLCLSSFLPMESMFWSIRSANTSVSIVFNLIFRYNARSSRPEVLLGKDVLKICSKFTGEYPCRSVISIKLLCNFTEITLRHGCSPLNLLDTFRTPFFKNTSGWLLL